VICCVLNRIGIHADKVTKCPPAVCTESSIYVARLLKNMPRSKCCQVLLDRIFRCDINPVSNLQRLRVQVILMGIQVFIFGIASIIGSLNTASHFITL